MKTIKYIAIIRKEDNSDYGINFQEFPGLISSSKDIESIHQIALEGLAFHIGGLMDDNISIPSPLAIHQLSPENLIDETICFWMPISINIFN